MKGTYFFIFIFHLICIISGFEKGNRISLKNIFIAVKTTQKHEKTRLPIILNTWFTLAKDQTWFFTDVGETKEFDLYQNKTDHHMIVTKCGKSHTIHDLCCKTNAELNVDLLNGVGKKIRWFCHFDDDNYVNIPKLVEVLQQYDYSRSWYLGRKYMMQTIINNKQIRYHFGNLGAGVCISRTLLVGMKPHIRNHGFVRLCRTLGQPDTISLGFLIEVKLGVNLTDVPVFHSHLDQSYQNIPIEKLKDQVSVGYVNKFGSRSQIVAVPGFDVSEDPSRFYSIHCFLGFCKNKSKHWFRMKLEKIVSNYNANVFNVQTKQKY